MRYIILALIFSLPACTYSMVPTQQIQALSDLKVELDADNAATKDRMAGYKASGNTAALTEADHSIGVNKAVGGIVGDVVGSAKKVIDIPREIVSTAAPFIPPPYGSLIQGALALATAVGGAYGCKKGYRVITRNKRIKSAIGEVKSSSIGGSGEFNPCSPQILEALSLSLDADDYKHYCQINNCA